MATAMEAGADVRELTPEQLEAFTDLAYIFQWVYLKGDLKRHASAAGSFIELLGGEMEVDEMALISLLHVAILLRVHDRGSME